MSESNVALERLEDQRKWLGRKSAECQWRYKRLKVVQIIMAALIPFVAGLSLSGEFGGIATGPFLTGALGVLVVVLEGVQNTFSFHENWITYRATSEALKSEKVIYQAGAGAYADAAHPDRLLAENVEAILKGENSGWVAHRREAANKQ